MEDDGRRTLTCSPELFDDLARDLAGRSNSFRVRVWGRSMHPTIQDGDVVVAEPVAVDALKLGDIVLYSRPGGHVIHRLVAVTDSGASLITRGEAYEYSDPPIRPEQVIARVISIEHGSDRRPLLARIRSRCGRVVTRLSRSVLGTPMRSGRA